MPHFYQKFLRRLGIDPGTHDAHGVSFLNVNMSDSVSRRNHRQTLPNGTITKNTDDDNDKDKKNSVANFLRQELPTRNTNNKNNSVSCRTQRQASDNKSSSGANFINKIKNKKNLGSSQAETHHQDNPNSKVDNNSSGGGDVHDKLNRQKENAGNSQAEAVSSTKKATANPRYLREQSVTETPDHTSAVVAITPSSSHKELRCTPHITTATTKEEEDSPHTTIFIENEALLSPFHVSDTFPCHGKEEFITYKAPLEPLLWCDSLAASPDNEATDNMKESSNTGVVPGGDGPDGSLVDILNTSVGTFSIGSNSCTSLETLCSPGMWLNESPNHGKLKEQANGSFNSLLSPSGLVSDENKPPNANA